MGRAIIFILKGSLVRKEWEEPQSSGSAPLALPVVTDPEVELLLNDSLLGGTAGFAQRQSPLARRLAALKVAGSVRPQLRSGSKSAERRRSGGPLQRKVGGYLQAAKNALSPSPRRRSPRLQSMKGKSKYARCCTTWMGKARAFPVPAHNPNLSHGRIVE